MLRYQASVFGDAVDADAGGSSSLHPDHSESASTVAMSSTSNSNGHRLPQQSRIANRRPMLYKTMAPSRLIPRRRYFVMDGQNQVQKSMTGSNGVTFPAPDYIKKIKENYESGKMIYIRRNIPGLKGTANLPSSVTPSSIRSVNYSTTTAQAPSRLVLRMPRSDHPLDEFSIPKVSSEPLFVPAIEPLCLPFPTVPASMSMGGEYSNDEGDEDDDDGVVPKEEDDELHEDGKNAFGNVGGFLSSPSSQLPSPQSPVDAMSFLEGVTSIRATRATVNSPVNSSSMLPFGRMASYNCPQSHCVWRGSSEGALRRHIVVHDRKPSLGMSNLKADSVKVTLIPPKPKGVKCSECDTFAYSRPLLLRHMQDVHGFEAPLIRKTFVNREMLQKWLDTLRETHAVEFVVSSGSKKWGRGLQVHYLTCSRSGDQKERPNKKYVRPPRPSIKCGRNCMAYLKIKQNPTVSELQIEGCLHHSGHEIDHTRIVLEKNELESVGLLMDSVNEQGLDICLNNIHIIRKHLGESGRFRLMTDRGIIDQMSTWFAQIRESQAINGSLDTMYNGSGPIHLHSSSLGGKSKALQSRRGLPMGCPRASAFPRLFNSGPLNAIAKPEKVTIRYSQNHQNINSKLTLRSPLDIHLNDELQVKREVVDDDEDISAVESLIKEEQSLEAMLDSPMIGGEDASLVDDVLLGGVDLDSDLDEMSALLAAADHLQLPSTFHHHHYSDVDLVEILNYTGFGDLETVN